MNSPREQAARWFLRLRENDSAALRREFDAWLTANDEHAREFQAFDALWRELDSPRQASALAGALERRQLRRTKLVRGTLCSLLLLASSVFGLHLYRQSPYDQELQTRIGERLEQHLRDGSELQLNGGTHLQVRFDGTQRRIELQRGEVIFDVVHDNDRPFVIEAGQTRVTVLGTRFVVDRLGERLRVSVARGRVRVESQDQQQQLHAGEVLEVQADGSLRRLDIAASNAFAFESGQLVFEQADLAEIAASLSRHRQQPVQAVTQGGPRISAVVQLADVETFLQALPQIAAVRLEQLPQATLLHPGK